MEVWIAIHLPLSYLLHSVSVYKKRCEIPTTREALCKMTPQNWTTYLHDPKLVANKFTFFTYEAL